MTGIIVGLTIFILIIIIQIVSNIIFNYNIDIFDDNIIQKIKKNNYEILEVKRKRHPSQFRTKYMIKPIIEDNIKVYGVKNNIKYLIYKIDWSEENMIKIKNIVNEINNSLNE
jgi:hypothetical protein